MKMFFTVIILLFSVTLKSQSFNEILVYFNTDGGTQNSIAAADFDNDGLKDVLMASSNPNVFWVKNLGNNQFGPKIGLFDEEVFGECAKPIDINNDGNMDIAAVCSFSNIVITILGNGDGTFQEAIVIEDNLEPLVDLKVFDVNQDGYDDLTYSTYSSVDKIGKVYWSKNDGNGGFIERKIIAPSALETNNIEFADLNNDQLPDLVSKSRWDDKFTWFQNFGNDVFSSEIEIRPPLSSLGNRPLFSIDIDDDNDIDLLTYENEGIAIFTNDGEGNFMSESISTSSYTWGISASDFNHDGVIDIFCGLGSNKEAIILYGSSEGAYQNELILASDVGHIIDIWIEDMDNNGTLDILTASSLYDGYVLFSNQNELSTINLVNNYPEIEVFPNPATNYIYLKTSESIMSSLELIDLTGRSVYYEDLHKSKYAEVNTSNLIKGYYSLIIKDNRGKIISKHKIIKQ